MNACIAEEKKMGLLSYGLSVAAYARMHGAIATRKMVPVGKALGTSFPTGIANPRVYLPYH